MKRYYLLVICSLSMVLLLGACKNAARVTENEEVVPVTTDIEKEAVTAEVNQTTQSSDSIDTNGSDQLQSDQELNLDVIKAPVVMPTPPFAYYLSDKVVATENKPISLNMILEEKNEIIDEEKWFTDNNLTINAYEVPNSYREVNGNLPDEISLYWNDLIITSAIYDDLYIYCTYGSNYAEGYILNIYDAVTLDVVYSFDFSSYCYSPEYIVNDYDFIQQKIKWATIKDNVLYLSHDHNTYAKSSNNMNAYITAIDLSDMSMLWRTDALVSNSNNFIIIDDILLSGYGFSKESDYIYQIDIYTGNTLAKTPLKTQASYIIQKDNKLYIRTYNTNYIFEYSE